LNHFTFKYFNFERTWWRFFQIRVMHTWAYLMNSIPDPCRAHLSVPDEGYSRPVSCTLERTWWRLFQTRVVHTWASPDEGYSRPVSCTLERTWWRLFQTRVMHTWASPDEGYSRPVSCTLNVISTFCYYTYIIFECVSVWLNAK
jgi:hypothetical protein